MEQNNKPNRNTRRQPMSGLYPRRQGYVPARPVATGGVVPDNRPVEYNAGRRTVTLKVTNTGDRPIQVGSHFHFFEVNRYLEFDRDAAFGCHLNIPATTAVRFEPGDTKTVELVAYAGKRRVVGFNNLVMGYTGDEDAPGYFPARTYAFMRVRSAGFKIAGGSGGSGGADNGPDENQAPPTAQKVKKAPAARGRKRKNE